MAEVVHNSLQYMSGRGHQRDGHVPEDDSAEERSGLNRCSSKRRKSSAAKLLKQGQKIYADNCAKVSRGRKNGLGMPAVLPTAREQPVDSDAVGGQPDPYWC